MNYLLNLMQYMKIEDKIYNFITKMFVPRTSYTKEHLEEFAQAVGITLPGVKITSKEIGNLLNQIYNIESKKYKECPQLTFLFNKIYKPSCGQGKRFNVYTIKDYLTLENIIKQNKLDDLSLKVLRNLVNERIKEIEKDAIEINKIDELFV